ncbi:Calcineurin-like phosphoesterase domain, ApaH type [Dillenia turbinata]|uniref:Calcineurin-like phosphoesterase domain, ApaH type n=1 Tax=Dillenia turbinata TaxID=194707 RepID=A0AAN8ZLA9_9MAGN
MVKGAGGDADGKEGIQDQRGAPKLKRMQSNSKAKLLHSLAYVTLISAFLHLLRISIFTNLQLGHHKVILKKQSHLPLRFRSDGTFKILQVADMHFGKGKMTRCRDVGSNEFRYCTDLNTTRFLRRVIEAENPDFIAFTGDNIFGASTDDAAESLIKAFAPAMESRLPWAAVLGNHDQESTMNREELMSFISLMDYSISQVNPSIIDSCDPTKESLATNIDGYGNYNIEIQGPPGSHLANMSVLNLFFLDSGDRATVDGIRTYGWIKESQLCWLRGVSQEYQGLRANIQQGEDVAFHLTAAPPPALAFFHIPVPEVRQLYYKKIVGKFQEGVACSSVNSGVLQTFVSMGDVKAVFMGHDHKNDFCGNLDGIWFCYGGGFGYHAYGTEGWPRRARIIMAELEKGKRLWGGVERIKTWKRIDDDKMSTIDEQVLWVGELSR